MPTSQAPSISESIARIGNVGVLPVLEVPSANTAERLFEALCAGGLPAAEITLRTPAGIEAIASLSEAYPDAFIGAGTVCSREDADRVIAAGARFVVSPGTDPDLIAFCCEREVLVVPGVCTPTEVQTAVRAGAPLLKFFPAEASGGIPFLKALSGPFRSVRFVPTGGISPTNLVAYLSQPQVVACGGSWMATPTLLAEGDFDRVRALTAEAIRIVAQVRSNA